MATITVVGAGMMGTALCTPLLDNGHDVRLVGTPLDDEAVASLRADHRHPGLEYPLSSRLEVLPTTELAASMDGVDVVALGVSSPGVRWAGQTVGPVVPTGTPIISVTKGLHFDGDTLRILPDVLAEDLPDGLPAPAAIGGPCIAGELAGRVPTSVIFAGRDPSFLPEVRTLFATDYYHIQISDDVVGVEVCAALKNAYAMAVGFGAGLHEARGGTTGKVAMHNYEAAIFAQASREMGFWVELLGGDAFTAMGLAGVGDLNVTCNGGRTSRLGRWLGLGLGFEDAVAAMRGATLESVDVIRILDSSLAVLGAQGRVGPADLPLLRHLTDIVVRSGTVEVPFQAF